MAVVPVPANGFKTVSPADENILIKRSASTIGKGAGCPFPVDSPLMSVQDERIELSISSFPYALAMRWAFIQRVIEGSP